MTAIRTNKYNNPAIGQVAESIAAMFAPPASGDMANWALARERNQKSDQVAQLFANPNDPHFDRRNIAVGNYNPTQSFYAQDQNNATAMRGQDITAQTDITKTLLAPVSKDATRFIPQGVADMYATEPMQFGNIGAAPGETITTPDGRVITGAPKPMSETEVKGDWLQQALESGAINMGDVATQYKSDTNVEKVLTEDGSGQEFVTRDQVPGRSPAPASPLVSMGGERAWDVESAKLFAKRYDEINGQASNAQQMLAMLSAADSALATGVYQGIGGEQLLDLQRFGTAIGLDNADQVAGGELVRAIQNRMSLLMRNPESGMGMPGAVSDRDIQFLKAAQPGLARSPEGNKQLLGMLAAMERRKIEIAALADTYVQENGRLDVGFNQAVRAYAEANPLFPDSSLGSTTGEEPAAEIGEGSVVVNPSTGERLVLRGGQWTPLE